MFDTMDQQLFTLARRPAVAELLGAVAGTTPVSDGTIAEYAGYTTMIFMIGWATGGLVFGVLGDRIGRVKTMIVTILFYSVFTGLSALSTGIVDFSAYRFLTGLGVGGQFAVGGHVQPRVSLNRGDKVRLGAVDPHRQGRRRGLRQVCARPRGNVWSAWP